MTISTQARFSIQIAVLAVIFSFVLGSGVVYASIADEIANKNRQIEELQRQIDAYEKEIEANHSKANTLQNEIARLNALINKVALEIRSLGNSIDETSLEIKDTQNKISDAEDKLLKQQNTLMQYIRLAYETDRTSLTEVLLSNATLSDFFSNINNLQITQDKLRLAIDDVKQLRAELNDHKDTLEDKRTDLERLKSLQELEKRDLDGNKSQKNKILKETKGQETKYQELVKKSKLDIGRIRDQIYYLQKNGVTAEEAVKFGHLAAERAGIRPAFLIAILEVESGLGRNVGTGNWMDDMYSCYLRLGKASRAEAEKTAFLAIVGKLGLDPNTVKVSREPNYGCGGAMGPAQFIATTWLAYEEEVSRVTGHIPPNPWVIEDAFTASAIKLARAGATSQTRAGEGAAARIYLSGRASCTSRACNSYASAVLRKADEIQQNL